MKKKTLPPALALVRFDLEQSRTGILTSVTEHFAFVQPDCTNTTVRLLLSRFRKAIYLFGGSVYSTGQSKHAHEGLGIVFTPIGDDSRNWFWAPLDEANQIREELQKAKQTTSVQPISLESSAVPISATPKA